MKGWGYLFCLGLAVGGFAEPARASGPCEQYGERLSDEQTAELKDGLIGLSSVGEVALAHQVRIRADDDPERLAPRTSRATKSAPPTIHIPNGFVKLQCQLVLIHVHSMIGEPSVELGRPERIGACVEARLPGAGCVRSFFAAAAEAAERRQWTQAERKAFADTAKAALLTTLLHEFAHLALGHVRTQDLALGARQEAEADLYALIRASVSIDLPTALAATYSSLSVADKFFEPNGGVHGRFACRAVIANGLIEKLSEPISATYGWVTGGATPARTDPVPILGDSAGCPRTVPVQVGPLQEDLKRMAAALAKYGRAKARAATIESEVDALLALPLADPDARRLRMSLISVRLRAVENDLPGPIKAKLQALAERALKADPAPAVLSGDYGRLLGTRAILDYESGPPKSVLAEMISRTRPRLTEALYYHPEFGTVHMQLGIMAYVSDRCEEGRGHFEQMVRTARDPAKDRAMLQRVLQPMDAAACAKMAREMRDYTLDRFDWD